MLVKPLILWTDALIYLLLVFVIVFVIWSRHDHHFRTAWRQVMRKKVAVVSFIILILYGIVGLLDSIHLVVKSPDHRSSVMSLFDYLARPLTTHDEKTYSAPLATHLYSKEFVTAPDGTIKREYPPVQYPYHLLGTDRIGQDVLYETLKSIRTGLIIGTLTTLIILPFAVLFGMCAGYYRGWVDDAIQYLYTTLSSIPDVLLIAAAVLAWEIFMTNHPKYFASLLQFADVRLLTLCVILGVTSWTGLCRLLRGETLKIRELDYVSASRALGANSGIILMRHILPNIMHLILIAVVMDFSSLVLAEAVLTYIGVGVDPSTISWGNMIYAARQELARDPIIWWPLFAAFLFMFPLVMAANLFADYVRDALDPRGKS